MKEAMDKLDSIYNDINNLPNEEDRAKLSLNLSSILSGDKDSLTDEDVKTINKIYDFKENLDDSTIEEKKKQTIGLYKTLKDNQKSRGLNKYDFKILTITLISLKFIDQYSFKPKTLTYKNPAISNI